MGRYRPPREKGTPLITARGEARLRDELEALWRVERPQVAQVVQDAAKNGDRSENGDYIYGKKRLREIDSRVRFLSKRLEQLKVVRDSPTSTEQVFFAATVDIENGDGSVQTITILGPDEFEPENREISIDAPVARAILGRRVGDEISLDSPQGPRKLKILAIRYANQDHTT